MDDMQVKSLFGDYVVQFGFIPLEDIINDSDIAIIDRKVFELYKDVLGGILNEKNSIIVEATEELKSYEGLIPVIREIIERGFHKNGKLIAIGGGIVQDSVAFISSILYRGVEWVHIPTTLLAQCDSCIGSKTSVNFGTYKNQIGGFYPPKNIYIDMNFIKTLSDQEFKSGMGEMLHYYVIGGIADFTYYMEHIGIAKTDQAILETLVKRSLEIKKSYIEIDEFDKNERQIFNYGHSFGHAIESITGYRIPHGIAVSYGIDIANYIAVRMGIQNKATRLKIREAAAKFWSDGDLENLDVDVYVNLLKKDKKNKGNKLGIILCADFGKLKKHMIDADDAFIGYLKEYFGNKMYRRENINERI